jgi:hypothetical protein
MHPNRRPGRPWQRPAVAQLHRSPPSGGHDGGHHLGATWARSHVQALRPPACSNTPGWVRRGAQKPRANVLPAGSTAAAPPPPSPQTRRRARRACHKAAVVGATLLRQLRPRALAPPAQPRPHHAAHGSSIQTLQAGACTTRMGGRSIPLSTADRRARRRGAAAAPRRRPNPGTAALQLLSAARTPPVQDLTTAPTEFKNGGFKPFSREVGARAGRPDRCPPGVVCEPRVSPGPPLVRNPAQEDLTAVPG